MLRDMTDDSTTGRSGLRLRYSTALDALDPDAILAALHPGAEVRVAVHDAPMQGPAVAFLFGVLRETLEGIEVDEEIVEGDRAVVLFRTRIEGRPAQGVNVLRLDEDGQVADLVVFFRPLAALERIATVVGARMAERFGPPPPDAV